MKTFANAKSRLLVIVLAMAMIVSFFCGMVFMKTSAAELSAALLVNPLNGATVEANKSYTTTDGSYTTSSGLYIHAPADKSASYSVEFNGIFKGSAGIKAYFPGENFWGVNKEIVMTVSSISDADTEFQVHIGGEWQQYGVVSYEWEGRTLWRSRGCTAGDPDTFYYTESGAKDVNHSQFIPAPGHFTDADLGRKTAYFGIEAQADGSTDVVLLSSYGYTYTNRTVIASFNEDAKTFEPSAAEMGSASNLPKLDLSKGYTISFAVSDTDNNKSFDILVESVATAQTGNPYETGTVYSMNTETLAEAPDFYENWQNAPAVEASELVRAGEGVSVSYDTDALGYKGITLNADKSKKTWDAEIAGVFSGNSEIRFALPYVNNQVNADTHITFTVSDLNGADVFKVVFVRTQWGMAASYVQYGSEIRSYTTNGNLADGWGKPALFYRAPIDQEQFTIPAINNTDGQIEGFVKIYWEGNVVCVSVLDRYEDEFVIAKFDGSEKPAEIPEKGYILQTENPAWGLPLLDGTNGSADLTNGYTIRINSDSPWTDVGLPATITSINGVSFANGQHVIVAPKMDSATFDELVSEDEVVYIRQGTEVGSVTAEYTLQMFYGWNIACTEKVTGVADTSQTGETPVKVSVDKFGISAEYTVTVEESYTISFAAQEGSAGQVTAESIAFSVHYPVTAEAFAAAAESVVPNAGYTFLGWYEGDSWTGEGFDFEDITNKNISLKAYFADVTDPVIALAEGIGDEQNSSVSAFAVAESDVVASDTSGTVTVTITINGTPYTSDTALSSLISVCGNYTVVYTAEDGAGNTASVSRTLVLLHNLEKTEAVEATCTEAGNIEYWTCSVCNKVFKDAEGKEEIELSETVIEAKGHNIVKVEAKAPTCTEEGNSEYWTCPVCNKVFKDAEGKEEIELSETVIAAKGHTLTKTAAVEATCTEAGNIEYWTCSVCNKVFKDAEGKEEIELSETVIAAKGHTLTKTEASEATCTEAGNIEYWTCSVCNKVFKDAEGKEEIQLSDTVIAAKGHTLTKTAAVEATCTEEGNTEYWTCSVCNKVFKDAEGTEEITLSETVIEAKGHNVVKVEAKAPTCTEAGNSVYYKCSECGKCWSDSTAQNSIDEASMMIPAKGHTYEDGVCTVCGAEDPDYVAPSGCGSAIAFGGASFAAAGVLAATVLVIFRKKRSEK